MYLGGAIAPISWPRAAGKECTGACTAISVGADNTSRCVNYNSVPIGTSCSDICGAAGHQCTDTGFMAIYSTSNCTGTSGGQDCDVGTLDSDDQGFFNCFCE